MLFEDLIINKNSRTNHFIFALIDPESKSNSELFEIVNKINLSNFDAILIGGSTLSSERFASAVDYIRSITVLKLIIFPSSSQHFSNSADAILFTTMLSSNKRKFIVGEQLKASKSIHDSGIAIIPTGYIHIDGGHLSSIQSVTREKPINSNDYKLIISYAYLCKNFGYSYIYLEAGSGAHKKIPSAIVNEISLNCNVPIIVGGGITTVNDIKDYSGTNVSAIVIGNLLETNVTVDYLKELTGVNLGG